MIDHEDTKQRLINLLISKRAILLAGAGSSISGGYPSWNGLVEKLRSQFAPHLE